MNRSQTGSNKGPGKGTGNREQNGQAPRDGFFSV